jgi:hypothetical protein
MRISAVTWLLAFSAPLIANACNDPPDHEAIRAHKRMLVRRSNNSNTAAASPTHPTTTTTVVLAAPSAAPPTPAPSAGTSNPSPGTAAPTSAAPSAAPPYVPPANPYATIPLADITSGAPAEALPSLATTYTAGMTPPVNDAPLLPSCKHLSQYLLNNFLINFSDFKSFHLSTREHRPPD